VVGLDALERARQRREPGGDRQQPPADLDQRERQHGHDDDRQDDREQDVAAHLPSNPSVSAFM
jgi:hypothetical protein